MAGLARPQVLQMSDEAYVKASKGKAELEIPFKMNDIKPKTQEQIVRRRERITAQKVTAIKVATVKKAVDERDLLKEEVKQQLTGMQEI